jgi:butyrate kinase
MKILAIDPGSTSTKLGLFDDDKPIYKESLSHNVEELSRFSTSFEQKDFRTQAVLEFLGKNNVDRKTIDAVIGREGIIKPLRAGTYTVNETMLGRPQEFIIRPSLQYWSSDCVRDCRTDWRSCLHR